MNHLYGGVKIDEKGLILNYKEAREKGISLKCFVIGKLYFCVKATVETAEEKQIKSEVIYDPSGNVVSISQDPNIAMVHVVAKP